MTATKKLRILCLHGYRQNDVLFREKTGSLRKQFKKYADFEFICAPLVPNVDSEDRGDVRGWWFSREDNQFSSRDICSIATGFEQSSGNTPDYIAADYCNVFVTLWTFVKSARLALWIGLSPVEALYVARATYQQFVTMCIQMAPSTEYSVLVKGLQ
ncbi:hypothetical protein NECAME_08173 [Necator americanus]|uniref:Serine hydrolase domain-containing protein n=1 Tax=Necator americanus TaxID=51031 RepID=W2TKC2_NECAM|nr:hypothetical protein NECAME_08173 [Necator americanus]ETN82074.1 hypothetical protein NECAME_08173 [Necator americanus]